VLYIKLQIVHNFNIVKVQNKTRSKTSKVLEILWSIDIVPHAWQNWSIFLFIKLFIVNSVSSAILTFYLTLQIERLIPVEKQYYRSRARFRIRQRSFVQPCIFCELKWGRGYLSHFIQHTNRRIHFSSSHACLFCVGTFPIVDVWVVWELKLDPRRVREQSWAGRIAVELRTVQN